jgi:TPP-dependent pyruvate/acetoin dehydrogenase alpha subunit
MKKFDKDILEIFEKASLCRLFEESVFERVQNKIISIPVYLSAGQEYISASIATFYKELILEKNIQIFIQHRGHSSYISFGGDIEKLAYELMGSVKGCAGGMGGSASIHSVEANIYGHDGLMGSQGPISVGMCYANRVPTVCFIGDAAAEEDYFLASLGWASTKKLPIIFVVEDNDLSILTEKKVRRNWEIAKVASAFNIDAYEIDDDPSSIYECLPLKIDKPVLLNINTKRYFWHSGAGIDNENLFDRNKEFANKIDKNNYTNILNKNNDIIRKVWEKCEQN